MGTTGPGGRLAAKLIRVGGTRLFVDDRGDGDAPPLLFIHGGPGQGCYDFMASVGDLLARRLRVIGVDQRGALRSEPLPASPPLTADLLIADFETLRVRLRIGSWVVLAHSAGASYALRYAVGQVGAVRAVIFDCPCWDADLTDRYRLPVVARRLEELGQLADAEHCRELAAKSGRLTFRDDTRQAMRALGANYMEHFFHDPGSARRFAKLMDESGLTADQLQRGNSHWPLRAALYEPVLSLLPRVRRPALLLRGQDDLVTTPGMVAEFEKSVPGAAVRTFASSGHFAYLEEPAAYCAAVTEFVLAHGS
jgi:proline iminopeptidase